MVAVEDSEDPSAVLYDAARQSMEAGDLDFALNQFQESLKHAVHFKTLELIGEIHCRLGRHREAIVPLAAATALNQGSRAPCLLAEAFMAIGESADAEAAATEALRRAPDYRRAREALERARRRPRT